MRTILTGCLAVIMAFALGQELYARSAAPQPAVYDAGPQTYLIFADDENAKEVIIPEEGVGPIYHVYEGGTPEVTEASVVVTLTIDENGNIAE